MKELKIKVILINNKMMKMIFYNLFKKTKIK